MKKLLPNAVWAEICLTLLGNQFYLETQFCLSIRGVSVCDCFQLVYAYPDLEGKSTG